MDITVSRNFKAESAAESTFAALQSEIYNTFGREAPSAPVLRCRNATQTSVVLEWDPIQLATSQLRSLSLYRDGNKAGSIPRPLEMQSTKITGLAVDTQYIFQLVLRTSAGTYSSEKLTVRTHKMTDLSGITVTPGIMPTALRESVQRTVDRIGAKLIELVRIDTTHFVCTEGRGPSWEKAVEMNIPVVVPDWLHACEREGRIVGVRGYYLNADPRVRQVGQGVGFQQQQAQQTSQERTVPIRQSSKAEVRAPTPDRPSNERSAATSATLNGPNEDEPPPPPPPKGDGPATAELSYADTAPGEGKATNKADKFSTSKTEAEDETSVEADLTPAQLPQDFSEEDINPPSNLTEKFDEVAL